MSYCFGKKKRIALKCYAVNVYLNRWLSLSHDKARGSRTSAALNISVQGKVETSGVLAANHEFANGDR